MQGDHTTERDPSSSFDPFGLIDKTAVVSGSSHGMCGSSSSSAILFKNRPNGSQKSRKLPPVFKELLIKQGDAILNQGDAIKKQADEIQKQGERVDRALHVFEHQSESIKTQVAMLTVQGSMLKQHNEGFGQIMKDHQKLKDDVAHVRTEVGRQGSVLEKQETTLEMVKDRVGELWKGRRDYGNPKLRRSTRVETSGTPVARTSASGKYPQVQCNFCQKTLSSGYIRKHISICPVLHPKPRGSK